MGSDLINAWDDIKSAFPLGFWSMEIFLIYLSACLVCLSRGGSFECLLGYEYQLPQSCSAKRVQLPPPPPPFGKTSSVGWISSFYTNILIIETTD